MYILFKRAINTLYNFVLQLYNDVKVILHDWLCYVLGDLLHHYYSSTSFIIF